MTTERLFEFLMLSQTLNYSKAAKKLFITQSALSRHIIELEKELGVKVLDRSTHSVHLTQAGRVLAQRSGHLIRQSEAALSRLRLADAETCGSIRVACLESTAYDQFMIFMTGFTAKYQDIDISIDMLAEADRAAVVERYDFTFSVFELKDLPERITEAPAFTVPAALYVLAGHSLIDRHSIGLEDLAGETLLVPYADEMVCSYSLNRQLTEKLTGNRVNIVKVPTVESAMMMTALGRGVSILPQHTAQNTLANIWAIDISTPGCLFETYVYWNQGRGNPTAKLMKEELDAFSKARSE